MRREDDNPKFTYGQLVRHRASGQTGVIICVHAKYEGEMRIYGVEYGLGDNDFSNNTAENSLEAM